MSLSSVLLTITVLFSVFFTLLLCMVYFVLRGSDSRLNRANTMVMELTKAVHILSESIQSIERTDTDIQHEYVQHIEQVTKNRDEILDAYKKLLERYKLIEQQSFQTLQELARRPNITTNNNNGLDNNN